MPHQRQGLLHGEREIGNHDRDIWNGSLQTSSLHPALTAHHHTCPLLRGSNHRLDTYLFISTAPDPIPPSKHISWHNEGVHQFNGGLSGDLLVCSYQTMLMIRNQKSELINQGPILRLSAILVPCENRPPQFYPSSFPLIHIYGSLVHVLRDHLRTLTFLPQVQPYSML